MSGIKIVTIVCWIITALALAGLAIWFVTGGWFGNWGDDMPFGINIGGFESLTGPFESQGTLTTDTTGIHSLSINWVAGDITLQPHDGSEIQITEFAQRDLRENERMNIRTESGKLIIEFRERGNSRGNMPRKNLDVLVPHELSEKLTSLSVNTTSGLVDVNNFTASSVNISSVSAAISISGINSPYVDLSTTSGTVTASSIKTDTLDISSVSGATRVSDTFAAAVKISGTSGGISISGDFDKVDVSTVSGGTVIKSITVPGSVNVSSVSGGIDLYIPDTGDITVSHSAVSGRFSSEVPAKIQNDAAYSFSTVSGNTNIHILG